MKRLLLPIGVLLLAGCSRGNDAAEPIPPLLSDKFTSDHFLQFFNKQTSLGAGDYRLVVVPAAVGTGTYSIVAIHDDGIGQSFSGAWTGAAAPDPADPDDPQHSVTLTLAGGLSARLDASAAACLFLLDAGGNILARAGDADAATPQTPLCDTGGTAVTFNLPHSKTNDPGYARAYYATIDSANARDTLPKFQQANGFGAAADVHVIFRDTKDLGYGRDMHFHDKGAGQYAFYVDNYVVNDQPGLSYGPLNLEAAIGQVAKYHIGTNAIEYGPIDANGDSATDDVNFDGLVNAQDYFPRFYNFSPDPPYERRLTVNLDGKGEKAMPGPCIVCHGGRADALTPNAVNGNPDSHFWRGGDTLAHLQPLDVGTFEYSGASPWTRTEVEPNLKLINQAVYASYAANAAAPTYQFAEWDSTMAREMLENWYGGAGLPGAFNDSYVPDGWNPAITATAPAGADSFYRDVLKTSCRTCHLLRGIDYQSDIDFTSYDKFIGYAARVEDLVFDRGVMPLATLTFRNFHETTALASELADFLAANATFSHRLPDGTLLLPGRPVARAGPDFRSPSPAGVSGAASLFARTYQWSITSGPVGASLDDAASVRPKLTGPDGTYVLRLVVSDGISVSDPSDVTVTMDSAMPRITFADIKNVIQVSPGECVACHLPGGGPPVFYTNPSGSTGSNNRDVYTTIRSLVDFADPENSRLLLKPSNNHHGGGLRTGFDLAGDRTNYDLFLNWILEGAPEN